MWENVWPQEIPELKPAIKSLTDTMKSTAEMLSQHLDDFVNASLPSLPPNYFNATVKKTEKVNCRLIHYYPL